MFEGAIDKVLLTHLKRSQIRTVEAACDHGNAIYFRDHPHSIAGEEVSFSASGEDDTYALEVAAVVEGLVRDCPDREHLRWRDVFMLEPKYQWYWHQDSRTLGFFEKEIPFGITLIFEVR